MATKPRFNVEDFPTLAETGGPATEERYVPEFIPLTSDNLNLEHELLEQYNRARKILHEASYDDSIAVNQKAAALNSATSIISALTRTQAELYSLERIKKIETVLIEVLKKFPELQQEFLARYEEALGDDT